MFRIFQIALKMHQRIHRLSIVRHMYYSRVKSFLYNSYMIYNIECIEFVEYILRQNSD